MDTPITPITPTPGATTPSYIQDNQQFKTVNPDGSLGLVTDNNVLQGLYGGTTKSQTIDQYNGTKLAHQPAIQGPSATPQGAPNTQAYGTDTVTKNAPGVESPVKPGENPDNGSFTVTPAQNNGGSPAGGSGSADTSGDTNSQILTLLKGLANPTTTPLVDSNSPEIQKYGADTTTNLNAGEDSQKQTNDANLKAEIDKATQAGNAAIGVAQNKMAAMGILGNSTYAIQYINDLNTKVQANITALNTKYQILNSKLDATTKQAIATAIQKEIDARNKEINASNTTLNKNAAQADSLYKTMSANELAQEKLKVQQSYNQGRLDATDAANKTKQITAEQNARKNSIIKGAKGAIYTQNPDGSLTPTPITQNGKQVSTANGTGPSTKAGKTVTAGEVSKYHLPSTTPQAEFTSIRDGINSVIKQSGGINDTNRYVLWGKVSDAISKAGGNAADYNALLWESFHPEGLVGYNKYIGGKPPKATSSTSAPVDNSLKQ